eukprot:Em0021g542a
MALQTNGRAKGKDTAAPSRTSAVHSSTHLTLEHSNGSSQPFNQSVQLQGDIKSLVGSLLGASNMELVPGSNPRLTSVKPSMSPISVSSSGTNPATPITMSWITRKRGRNFEADDNPKRLKSSSYSSRQSGEKQHNKGLRHFSQRVCEKVREKGTTTYNEVADDLVKELTESERKAPGSTNMPIDHKNIRRRVYDALNVLMAMNIISKEKKEIRWIGLPTNSVQECEHIEMELGQAEQDIQSKKEQLEDLLIQILCFKNLMKRNREKLASTGAPPQNSAISLPFIVVNTSKKTTIDCSISSDKSEYVFNFDNAFELHNDVDILKKMGLDCGLHSGTCTAEDIKQAKSMLPKAFESTLNEMVIARTLAAVSNGAVTPTNSFKDSPSLTSTPNLKASPVTASPGVKAVHGHGSPVASSPLSAVNSSPLLAALSSLANAHSAGGGSSSPGAVTALVTSALRAGRNPPVVARPLTQSPISAAKSQLHTHGPTLTQTIPSPLLKSATGYSQSPSLSLSTTLLTASPQVVSKSPGPKIVTVSKLNTPELTAALLQLLQQNSNLLKQGSGTTVTGNSSSLAGAGGLLAGMAGSPVASPGSAVPQQTAPVSTGHADGVMQ